MDVLIFLVVTGIFMVPFSAAVFYFFLGIRGYMVGRKERSKAKMIGGYNSMAYSFLGMFAIAFLWYVIAQIFLGIQL